MTRREEIEQAAMQVGGVHPDWDALECFRVGYKEGAKWADKTMKTKMLDKVKAMLDNYTRQLKVQGRPYDATMLITGKQEAALRILELLQED